MSIWEVENRRIKARGGEGVYGNILKIRKKKVPKKGGTKNLNKNE